MSSFWEGYLTSESSSRDVIRTKRAYIDINDGNLTDGVLFGRIMYWHLPEKKNPGKPNKLTVFKDNQWWLAKRHEDWYDECRIPAGTARDSIARMVERGLLETKVYHFKGKPAVHIRIVREIFEQKMAALASAGPVRKRRNPANSLNDGNQQIEDVSICGNPSDTVNDGIRQFHLWFTSRYYIALVTAFTTALITQEPSAPSGAQVGATSDEENFDVVQELSPTTPSSGQPPSPPKPKRDNAKLTALKNAIAQAFGWQWQFMTKNEAGTIQTAATQLYDAGCEPEFVPLLYKQCQKDYRQFGPVALTKVVSKVRQENPPAEPSAPEPVDMNTPVRLPHRVPLTGGQ